MPNLPALPVTEAQAAIITEVWAAMDPSQTPNENFRRWQRRKIIEEVVAAKRAEIEATYDAEVERLNVKKAALLEEWTARLQ